MALTDIVFTEGAKTTIGGEVGASKRVSAKLTKFILEVHARSTEVFERASERRRANFGSDEGSLTASSRGRSCSLRHLRNFRAAAEWNDDPIILLMRGHA